MSEWVRPPRAERYRVKGQREEFALQALTGATSATLGDLIALATLGADVTIHSKSGEIMRVDPNGSIVMVT